MDENVLVKMVETFCKEQEVLSTKDLVVIFTIPSLIDWGLV